MEENVDGTIFEQNKNDPNQEYYLDKNRGFEPTFSTTSPAKVIQIDKEKKTRLNKITRYSYSTLLQTTKEPKGSQRPRTNNIWCKHSS